MGCNKKPISFADKKRGNAIEKEIIRKKEEEWKKESEKRMREFKEEQRRNPFGL